MVLNLEIEKSIIEAKLFNDTVLLAVSGGPDSQVLLKAFSHVAKNFNIKCFAMGINHGLREDADRELDLAENLASELDILFFRRKVKVESGASVQAHARDARYQALKEQAAVLRARYIVTGHHFDDRAEAVLIRLLRGKNLGSLGVMPTVSGQIFRPMLKVHREEIMSYCKRWNLQYALDPSNDNIDYLRVKIRKEILPLFMELNPQFKARLNEIGDEALKL